MRIEFEDIILDEESKLDLLKYITNNKGTFKIQALISINPATPGYSLRIIFRPEVLTSNLDIFYLRTQTTAEEIPQ